jgi:hypothetical protein
MPAVRAGVFKIDPSRELKLRQKAVFKGYLTQEEVDEIRHRSQTTRSPSHHEDVGDVLV